MRVVFMGTPDFAVGTLEEILRAGHVVAGVVTQPDKPKGRGKTLQPTPVKEAAQKHGIMVYQPIKVREKEFTEQLRALCPEVIVVAAFGQIISKEILEIPKYGCINVHASLLPAYRGAAPIQWAVINGDKETGVTIMQMDEGLDTGDMIDKVVIPLDDEETGGSLFDKLSAAGAKLCVQVLEKLEKGTAIRVKQPPKSTTPYAAMINKKMGQIDWEAPAFKIEQLIRGLNPWPSAYTSLDGKNMKIWTAKVEEGDTSLEPGKIVGADKNGILVQTGKGMLRIEEIQLEGKKRMDAASFLRGYTLEPGQTVGK